jgi:hypothetical protein
MNELEAINLFPDKTKIEEFIIKVKGEVLSNNYNVCDFYAQAKCVEKTMKSLLDDGDLKKHLQNQFFMDNKKFYHKGVTFTLVEIREFICNTPKWKELDKQIKALKEELKKEEALYKLQNEPDYVSKSVRINL